MWGGYLGEVVRRRWGGEWQVPEEGSFAGKICLVVNAPAEPGSEPQITVFPPERAYKQLCNGADENCEGN